MNYFFTAFILIAIALSGCYSTGPVTNGSADNRTNENARNWVIIMHGEPCGGPDEVANNMYVENNHETSTISVVVDISWTENGQARHENKSLSVAPDSKMLIGCDYRNGIYLKMEIVNASFN